MKEGGGGLKKFRFSFFKYVGDTPIIPVKARILSVFLVLLLLSTFSTAFIVIMQSHGNTIEYTYAILVDKLSKICTTANYQKQIESYSRDTEASIRAMADEAMNDFNRNERKSVALGIRSDGTVLFAVSPDPNQEWVSFTDRKAFERMESSELRQGKISFTNSQGEEFFGVFKYHEGWMAYFVRALNVSEVNEKFYRIMFFTVIFILVVAVIFAVLGTKILDGILCNIRNFTNQLYKMQQSQTLMPLDTSGAPNDDITYLAANFNSLSSSVDNLLQIFQKFVPENVVRRAHERKFIRLEGSQRELTILFSDIRNFTYRTEVLGNDIISLLNVHYDAVIKNVSENNGVIGSIIGDAILASYGIEEKVGTNKSLDAIKTAWEITSVTHQLRKRITARKKEIEKVKAFSEEEERVFEAVLIDVGVGIDGGSVFYGNIGSNQRMANTVIGDNVNSASRLEGLTRIYGLPVIVSEYIMQDSLKDQETAGRYDFYEIDTVQVKGKTEGVKIYIPLDKKYPDEDWNGDSLRDSFEIFSKGLSAYYSGDWDSARAFFSETRIDAAKVFVDRMGNGSAPEDWSGIWTMTSK